MMVRYVFAQDRIVGLWKLPAPIGVANTQPGLCKVPATKEGTGQTHDAKLLPSCTKVRHFLFDMRGLFFHLASLLLHFSTEITTS
jgi:hypothetical protein